MKIRLLYIVAQQVRWVAFEWVCRFLNRDRFALSFLLLNKGEPPLAPYLRLNGIPFVHIPYAGKASLPRAVWEVTRYCRREQIDIVHTHFMPACLAGLLGAALAGVRIRIHTRHHAGPLPWSHRLPWQVGYDWWNNRYSSAIVAPSKEVERTLLSYDKVAPGKVVRISHGFDVEAFRAPAAPTVHHLREKYQIRGASPVIGVIARYEKIKGIHFIIPAFRQLLKDYPSATLVLANARGRYRVVIQAQLRSIAKNRYVEIPFEEDIFALYRLFDVFVHVPTSPSMEAFGQVYVEALAAGAPSVFTKAGISSEFIVHRENAYVVDYQNSRQIYEGMKALLENRPLRERCIRNGHKTVTESFDLWQMGRRLEELYLSMHENGSSL